MGSKNTEAREKLGLVTTEELINELITRASTAQDDTEDPGVMDEWLGLLNRALTLIPDAHLKTRRTQ